MAEQSIGVKIGKSILSFLDNLFKTISSPIPGYDVSDVKVKQDGDNFSSLFQFTNVTEKGEISDDQEQKLIDKRTGKAITDVENNELAVAVLLRTDNAQTVLRPLYDAMNAMNDGKKFKETYDVSLRNFDELMHYLLNFDFVDNKDKHDNGAITFGGEDWSWKYIEDNLSFSLECESPGKDYGAITGEGLQECGNLIGEYLKNVGLIQSTSEVQIDTDTLVIPILADMQKVMGKYYSDTLKKFNVQFNDDSDEPSSDESNQGNPDNNSDQNGQDTQDNTQEDTSGMNPSQQDIEDSFNDASKHIDVTLQKVTGTSEIKMSAISANYDFGEVLDDIDEIINQDTFIQALPEEPTSYAIEVDDDGFDIEPCETCPECNPCESLCEVFKSGIRAYRNLYILHWMSAGNDMMKLHLMTEEMYEELQGEIDTLGELLVEKQGTVPQLDFPCDYIPVQKYDFQTGLDHIQSLISIYIDCIDYAYCNQDSDVQSTLDEWLRYWNKQLNYFIKNQEM